MQTLEQTEGCQQTLCESPSTTVTGCTDHLIARDDAVCVWEQVYLAGVQELGVDMLPSEQQRRTLPGSSLGWVL